MAGKSTSGRIILPDLTAAQLAAQNPVLKKRQLQFEGDTGKAKRGDGTTPWNNLPYVVGTDGKAATVKVGTVTTLQPGQPATVNNSGTENAAVLNFGIPQGKAGSGGGSADPNIGKGQIWVLDSDFDTITDPNQTFYYKIWDSIDPLENAFNVDTGGGIFGLTAKIAGVYLVEWEAKIEYSEETPGSGAIKLDYTTSNNGGGTLNYYIGDLAAPIDVTAIKTISRTSTVRMNNGDRLALSHTLDGYLTIETKFSITKIA